MPSFSTVPSAKTLSQNHTPGAELAATTVMYKKTGYNPDHNSFSERDGIRGEAAASTWSSSKAI